MKKQTQYVDGFVFVVPKNKLAQYRKMAEFGKKIWMKYGALDYKECMSDEKPKMVPGMEHRLFSEMTKAKANETIWFSYILFKSKKHRNEVNAKVMKDSVMNDPKYKNMPMPFDMKKMAYGGFKVIVSS